jgi:hypothetical protein
MPHIFAHKIEADLTLLVFQNSVIVKVGRGFGGWGASGSLRVAAISINYFT